MLAVMYLVMANDGVAVCAYLDASQRIAVNVIEFNKSSALAKYINATLVPVEDLIFSERNTFALTMSVLKRSSTLKDFKTL